MTVEKSDSIFTGERKGFHFALWSGVLGAPAAWAIQFLTIYALVPHVCAIATNRSLYETSIACFLIGLAALGISIWNLRNCDRELEETCEAAKFLSQLGILTSAFFCLLMATHIIPTFFISPCIE